MGKTALVLIVVLSVFTGACTSDTAEKNNIVGQKRDGAAMVKKSELAQLMRNLYEELDSLKPLVQSGEIKATRLLSKFHRIDVAIPTDSADSGPVFESFAGTFKARLELLDAFPDSVEIWNNMVGSCVDCHKSYCPGPIKTIDKLKL
ncbi:MAG: hypothetical protein KDC37_01515 [Flavobacteriales bacterium]|jgi:hypothetical protein|nr:hypothetical protein [Flavobacteriales bacterium]